MPERDVRELVRAVLAADRALAEHRAPVGTRHAAAREADAWNRSARTQAALAEALTFLMSRLDVGDGSATGPALDYLEEDPYYFRSGYARNKLARRLARVSLTGEHARRARALVLAVVDGDAHTSLPGTVRLAGAVADNDLRRALRLRLRSPDATVARRALRILVGVRHPGLTPDDLAKAQALVLADAGRHPYLAPTLARLARWLWTPQWEKELAGLTRVQGPDRAAAKRLVEQADRARARARRPGP